MKKRLLIGILGFAGLLTACSEDEIDFYTGPAAVNITIDGDGTFVQGESIWKKHLISNWLYRANIPIRIGF